MMCSSAFESMMLRAAAHARGLAVRDGLRPLAAALVRLLVGTQALETRLPQQAVLRPFGVSNLGNQARLDPVHVRAARRSAGVKGTGNLFDLVEALAQVEKDLMGEPGPDLAGVNQAFARIIVTANEQGPQADT